MSGIDKFLTGSALIGLSIILYSKTKKTKEIETLETNDKTNSNVDIKFVEEDKKIKDTKYTEEYKSLISKKVETKSEPESSVQLIIKKTKKKSPYLSLFGLDNFETKINIGSEIKGKG